MRSTTTPVNDILSPENSLVRDGRVAKRIADPQNATVPRLAWTQERMPEDEYPAQRERYQRLIFTPPNLVAALWLHFARTFTGNYQLKACPGCGKYFLIGPGAKNAGAQVCGGTCRTRKNRGAVLQISGE